MEISEKEILGIVMALEQCKKLMEEGIGGFEYDPSWMRPRKLGNVERESRLKQVHFIVKNLIENNIYLG